jgi:hypothetical protein
MSLRSKETTEAITPDAATMGIAPLFPVVDHDKPGERGMGPWMERQRLTGFRVRW